MAAKKDNNNPKVFISHAWVNKGVARQLEEKLRAAGAEVWVDHVGIRGGDSLPKRISDALEWCDTLVLVWSEAANASEWVALEWENAISLKKRIIPCLLDGTKLPAILARMAYLDFRNVDQGIVALLKALGDEYSPRSTFSQSRDVVGVRSHPVARLSVDNIVAMLKVKDFFEAYRNKDGRGLQHQYEAMERKRAKLVIDHTTGLTWQQSGSPEELTFTGAEEYIRKLNNQKFAGYTGWRLPTLEEAMSLMEPTTKIGDLYIDRVFDQQQGWIWTADKKSTDVAWRVGFFSGKCDYDNVDSNSCVRAVRSGQSII